MQSFNNSDQVVAEIWNFKQLKNDLKRPIVLYFLLRKVFSELKVLSCFTECNREY
jgi:hypothetical protein